MRRRVLTALVLVVIGLPGIIYGGIFYFVLMTIFLVGGAWEYVRMYRAVQYEPDEILTVGGVLAIATARVFFCRSCDALVRGVDPPGNDSTLDRI